MKRMIAIIITILSSLTGLYSQKPVFNHAAIYVTDLEKSRSFYQNIIGLDTIPNPFNDGKHTWFSIGDGIQLHVISGATAAEIHPQNLHLCFSVPSVESFIQKLARENIVYVNSRGVKNEITTRPDGVKQIYVTDPDGYWIEINDTKK